MGWPETRCSEARPLVARRGWGMTFVLPALLGRLCCGYQPSFASHTSDTQPHHFWPSKTDRGCRQREKSHSTLPTFTSILRNRRHLTLVVKQIHSDPNGTSYQPSAPHSNRRTHSWGNTTARSLLSIPRETICQHRSGCIPQRFSPGPLGAQGLVTAIGQSEGETHTQWPDYGLQ